MVKLLTTTERLSAAQPRATWRAGIAPAAIFLLAFALRLLPTIVFPGLAHPDELFQSLEQAHRLVFGYGEIPWEFLVGARSWLLPGSLAAFMWLGDQVKDSPSDYLGAIDIALAALAATSALCTFLWGRRCFGVAGGVVAAALPMLWPEFAYFGARALSECVAAPLLVLALYLIDAPAQRQNRIDMIAGALLGLAIILRLQLAPAVAVILLWRGVEAWRRRVPVARAVSLLGGMLLALAGGGALDALTWGYPFQSLWLYFSYNTFHGIASSFGVEPWFFYLVAFVQLWGWGAAALLLLIAIGGWRLGLPLAAAIAILATHSLVPHKEYRFIYPAALLLLVVAGMGLAELVAWAAATWRAPPRRLDLAAGTFVALLCLGEARSPAMASLWQDGHDVVRSASFVATLRGICGIGLDRTYGGAAYFHHNVPYFFDRTDADLARDRAGFDVLLTPRPVPGDFTTLQCFGKICVARRAGPCAPITPVPIFGPPAR